MHPVTGKCRLTPARPKRVKADQVTPIGYMDRFLSPLDDQDIPVLKNVIK